MSDETTFNPEAHAGIYKNDPQSWYPHYDVEYMCKDCGHYEHYTYDKDGAILAQRINKVIFDFSTSEFSIIDGINIQPAGKLPKNVEYGSDNYYKYLNKVLKKAYPKTKS